MEWNIFDEWVDEELYRQMSDLIFRTSTKRDKYALKKTNMDYELFEGEPGQSAEDAYGLNYPGEILERLGEHREITKKQVRSLGLALARSRNLQDDNMFIDDQLPAFMKKMQGMLGKNDLFFLGIRYLMEEKAGKDAYEKLISYPFQELSEILFALSVLPKDDGIWMAVKGKLNERLGKERKISVYENSKAYIWLAQNFQFRMKEYRKKDMDAVKALMKLPFVSISGSGQAVKEKLLANGYSEEELYFLNYTMFENVHLQGTVGTSSITAEKLAIETCRYYLNAEREWPMQIYALCSRLCAFYRSFAVKVNGREGILDTLAEMVTIKNVPSFQVLYPYTEKKENLRQWKRIDLTEHKWDSIYPWLPLQEYDECVTETLEAETDAAKIRGMLARYQEMTGKDFTQRFWDSYEYGYKKLFCHLCEYGAFSVVEMMKQFLEENRQDSDTAKKKWKSIAWYLSRYMERIQSYEAYAMLELLIDEAGISDILKPFSVTELLRGCFVEDSSWRYRHIWKLEIFRPFLDAEEHQKLFSWIEEYIFQYHTGYYEKFLLQVLSKEDHLLWFPKEEARAIYLELQGKTGVYAETEELRRLYLTEEERETLRNREKMREERKEMKQKLEERKLLKRQFARMVAGSRKKEGQFHKIIDFLHQYSYRTREETEMIAVSYLRSLFMRERVVLYAAEDMRDLCRLFSTLYANGKMDLETIKEFISKVEEAE